MSSVRFFGATPGWNRFVRAMRDTSRRNIYFSAMAVPGHLLVAGSKGVLLLYTPSLFMAANVLLTLGLAVIKLVVIRADRHAVRHGSVTAVPRTYRATGLIVLALALAYVAACLPLVLGHDSSGRYERDVAIAIATVAFTELGFSVHGIFSSRRIKDVLMEAIKLSNLASSLMLLVLTQTALLSMSSTSEDPSRYNGICGILLGCGAAVIGVYMTTRHRR